MFALLNQALIAQVVMMLMAATMAYAVYAVRTHDLRHSTFFRTYLIHLELQALATFSALGASTYLQATWLFEPKTSFPWIFGAAGLAVVTVFIAQKFWSAQYATN